VLIVTLWGFIRLPDLRFIFRSPIKSSLTGDQAFPS
jgi:hypothetical protein